MPSAVALSTIVMAGGGRTAPLSYRCLVPLPGRRLSGAGPGGLVESGPELHTELSPPSAGVHRISWQQGRYPKSVAFAPNATHCRCTSARMLVVSNVSTASFRRPCTSCRRSKRARSGGSTADSPLRGAVVDESPCVVGSRLHAFLRRRVVGEVLDQIIGIVERGVPDQLRLPFREARPPHAAEPTPYPRYELSSCYLVIERAMPAAVGISTMPVASGSQRPGDQFRDRHE